MLHPLLPKFLLSRGRFFHLLTILVFASLLLNIMFQLRLDFATMDMLTRLIHKEQYEDGPNEH